MKTASVATAADSTATATEKLQNDDNKEEEAADADSDMQKNESAAIYALATNHKESHATSELYIGEYGLGNGTDHDQIDLTNDDYQRYLTPIAVQGEYPEIEDQDTPIRDGETTIHNSSDNKPIAHKGPPTLQNGNSRAALPAHPMEATDVDMDDYRNKRQFPAPFHFLWIKKKRRWHKTAVNQFDDADERDLVGPQYDPKTLQPSIQVQIEAAARSQPNRNNRNPYPSIQSDSRTAPFQTTNLPPGTPATTSPPTPTQSLNASMARAQQLHGIDPASAIPSLSPQLHQHRLLEAKVELVKAYEKVQALQKTASPPKGKT